MKTGGPALAPLLLREREVAVVLGVSVSLVAVFRRRGWLTPIALPGIRSTRYATDEVKALAAKWIADAGAQTGDAA